MEVRKLNTWLFAAVLAIATVLPFSVVQAYAGTYGYNHNMVSTLDSSFLNIMSESDSDVEIITVNSFTSSAGLHYDRVAHYSMSFTFLDGKKHSGSFEFLSNIAIDRK